ncbi:MAG: endolytic transglycosylase MltG, partial [Oxalobacter sp.]|nr:endolytic transglycosylase MltG [Oxalobacter sp.]
YESITIVEGWTFKQMREAMAAHPKLKHDTDHLTERELIEQLKITWGATEGLFFPSTYLFMRGASDMQIYRQAHEELMKRLYAYWEKRDPALPYKTPYEALVMASIVEKETGHPEDRAHIAGVFTNRLKIGMKLQTDPTVIYGMGDKYKGVIYKSSLTTDTPYNTYTRFGLPPTPIALVGDAALNATFNPAKTEALYFVSRADGTGKSEFTTNLADHNRAVDKFLRNK